MPKILFIGDIVGRPGRDFVIEYVPKIKKDKAIDFVIVNGENSAGGSGINKKIVTDLLAAGVDAITLGDHVWGQKGFDKEIGSIEQLCRPANLAESCPGQSRLILEKDGFRLGIFTILGYQFMKIRANCPFRSVDVVLNDLAKKTDGILAEIHAETTSEKVAMGWYLDGRASAVIGTHTHIPTADARVLPRGTGYITDTGMSGPYQSCLGREIDPVIGVFLDGMPRRFSVAERDVRLCGVLLQLDASTGLCESIERVEISQDKVLTSSV